MQQGWTRTRAPHKHLTVVTTAFPVCSCTTGHDGKTEMPLLFEVMQPTEFLSLPEPGANVMLAAAGEMDQSQPASFWSITAGWGMHRQHWDHAVHTNNTKTSLKNHLHQHSLLHLLTVHRIITLILDLSGSLEPA